MASTDVKIIFTWQAEINRQVMEIMKDLLDRIEQVERALRECDATFDQLLDKE